MMREFKVQVGGPTGFDEVFRVDLSSDVRFSDMLPPVELQHRGGILICGQAQPELVGMLLRTVEEYAYRRRLRTHRAHIHCRESVGVAQSPPEDVSHADLGKLL
jgi:hypothetical protein